MTGTPGRNSKHGETPCAQGARRDPQSARSNVTASQPEKDSSAEVFCRATPVLCAPPTATSIGAHQPREEDPPPLRGQSGDVQAEPATTPSRGKNNKNRERTNWTSLRASVRTRAVSWRQAQPAYIQFPAAFSGQATSPTLDRGELSELDGHGGISVIAATALMAWICQATGLSISCRPRDDGRHVLSPTWAWQLHSAWESGPSDLVACAARCVRKCWTAQPFRITELFLLALLPAHGSNCGHFIAARYKFDSTSAITIWDSLKGDSTSCSGTNFLSDTYVALRAALERTHVVDTCTTQAQPRFNRDRVSRASLQHEGLDCAFFAACNVIGAMVGREAHDCTLSEARRLRALARDLLWSGGTSQESLATAQAEGEETLRLWCKAYGECRTHTLPEPAESSNQRQGGGWPAGILTRKHDPGTQHHHGSGRDATNLTDCWKFPQFLTSILRIFRQMNSK